jgi:hypothetical protein
MALDVHRYSSEPISDLGYVPDLVIAADHCGDPRREHASPSARSHPVCGGVCPGLGQRVMVEFFQGPTLCAALGAMVLNSL